MNFLPENIQKYAEDHSLVNDDLLNELYRETHLKVMYPRMISGPYQGRLLSFLSKLVQPKCILEIGTYTGYAALCLAEGLQQNGMLHTIEIDPEIADFANSYFNRSSYKDKIKSYVGDALSIIPSIEEPIDLVFIDAQKEQYIDYYTTVFPKLASGSLILADNVLWSGQVVDNSFQDDSTIALRSFNKFILQDDKVEKIMLPVRDGLFMIRKL